MTSRELLVIGAKELGNTLSNEQVNALFDYLSELSRWNKKINLTSIHEERDVVIKHVLDSLSHVKGFAPVKGLGLLDMGSGAGFPALPIKIAYPEIAVTLVESVKKKGSFLRHIVRTLGLQKTEILDKRIEELPESIHAAFDVITARAFANMGTALSLGAPFLKPGGLMVLSRGPEETIEDKALIGTGTDLERKIDLVLPHSDYKRVIWVFKKGDQPR